MKKNINQVNNNKTKSKQQSVMTVFEKKVSRMSDEELLDATYALEMSTDTFIQTLFSFSNESMYEKMRKVIIKDLHVNDDGSKINVIDLLSIPDTHYPVDLAPVLTLVAQIQVYEVELEKRGLFEDFQKEMILYRVSETDDGEIKDSVESYPSYVVRMFDLILGYLGGIIDDRFTIRNMLSEVEFLTECNEYDAEELFGEIFDEDDVEDDDNHDDTDIELEAPANPAGFMS